MRIYTPPQSKRKPKAKRDSAKARKVKLSKLNRIQRFAGELNKNLPASERWFQNRFKALPIAQGHFYNVGMTYYIPDCVNFDYRYIIEIDGSIHNSPQAKEYDRKRTEYFHKRGYKVFRIEAFSDTSYNACITEVLAFRSHFETVKKTEP